MNPSEKIEVHITDTGYLINPKIQSFSYEIPFGGIVKETLEKYHNQQKEDYIKSLGTSEQFKVVLKQSNRRSIKNIRNQSIWMLPLLMSDREQFINSFSSADTLFPNRVEILNVWDKSIKKIVQVFYITGHEDLLLYDIGQVIERGIYIRPCAYCGRYFIQKRKQERYCSEHREIGQAKTRSENFNRSPCRQLEKLIYNRLKNRVSGGQVQAASSLTKGPLDIFIIERDDMKAKYKSGEITQEEYLSWLNEQERETSIYKKRKQRRSKNQ